MKPFGKPKFPWLLMPDLGAPIKEHFGPVETPHWGFLDRPAEYSHNLTSVIRQHVPILRFYNLGPDTAAIAANARYQAEMVAQSRRLGAPLAASPTRTTPPQSGGKREAPSQKGSQRASGDAKHRRAHKCPKGHYWSYKHKKCMKSKF